MKARKLWILVGLATSVGATAAYAGNDIEYDELPELVRMTVDREIGAGEIVEIEVDEEDGSEVFEIEFILDGIKYELDVAPDGTLISRHRD